MSTELLQEKALLLCNHCVSVGLPVPQFQMTSAYAVNFIWHYEGRKHILALYCKTTLQRWTLIANTDWVRQAILPSVQPLFEQVQAPGSLPPPATIPQQKQASVSPSSQDYFADAIACLSLLAPFAHDNMDFSIIGEQTRSAVRVILNDPTFSHLNRAALQAALELPNTSKFSEAKEYLTQCLTLCTINNAAN